MRSLAKPRLLRLRNASGERYGLTRFEPLLELVVDREKARFGTWYEMFVRSQGIEPGKPGTFRDAERRLPELRDLGFDVVYLPPIHPIGHTNRKGPGNALNGGSNSPGSPWAIGSEAGGHTAIDPSLGHDRTISIASTLPPTAWEWKWRSILQSSARPTIRGSASIRIGFNIGPTGASSTPRTRPRNTRISIRSISTLSDQRGLLEELIGVVRFWREHGVKIFRVDNPHTKPVQFWNWLINEVQATNPEVIFLAEAFTRPKMMKVLAKAGFTQSYTYFTWRNSKYELTEYLTELTQTPMKEYFRPNFFTNTPDILAPILQTGGRAAFKMRLVLAATLSPSYGIYSGLNCARTKRYRAPKNT